MSSVPSSKKAWLFVIGVASLITLMLFQGSVDRGVSLGAERKEAPPEEAAARHTESLEDPAEVRAREAAERNESVGANRSGQDKSLSAEPTFEDRKKAKQEELLLDAITKAKENRRKPFPVEAVAGRASSEKQSTKRGRANKAFLYPGQRVLCALDNKIVSDYNGSFTCNIQEEQYDIRGEKVVTGAGSVVFGQMVRQQGENQAINSAVQAVITHITTPDGRILKPKKAAAYDKAGVAAISGDRDYHMMAQILALGAAALFQVPAGLLNSAGQILSPQNNLANKFTNDISEAGRAATDKFRNISPTDTVEAGEIVQLIIQAPLYEDDTGDE